MLDYELQSEYLLSIYVCDNETCSTPGFLQLLLLNVNEPPMFEPNFISIQIDEELVNRCVFITFYLIHQWEHN